MLLAMSKQECDTNAEEQRLKISYAAQPVGSCIFTGVAPLVFWAAKSSSLSAAMSTGVSSEMKKERDKRWKHHRVFCRCFVNGTATSLRVLREIGAAIVDVNGQNAAGSIRYFPNNLSALNNPINQSAFIVLGANRGPRDNQSMNSEPQKSMMVAGTSR